MAYNLLMSRVDPENPEDHVVDKYFDKDQESLSDVMEKFDSNLASLKNQDNYTLVQDTPSLFLFNDSEWPGYSFLIVVVEATDNPSEYSVIGLNGAPMTIPD